MADIRKAIIGQDLGGALEGTKRCLEGGVATKEIIDAIAAALKEVGDLFECGELFLPEVMRSANAAKGALKIVLPMVSGDTCRPKAGRGRVAIGSLGPHDIGKTIVSSMLIGDGFAVTDLGVSLTPEMVEGALKGSATDILALSILLTSDLEKAGRIITKARQVKPGIRVMIGGAATSPKVATRIGADGHGRDAGEAVRLARKFMEGGAK